MGKKRISGFFKTLVKIFSGVQRTVTVLLFYGVVAALIVWGISSRPAAVPDSAVLILDPSGLITDQKAVASSPWEGQSQEVVLRSVLRTLSRAATDDRIDSLYLDMSWLQGAGLATLEELSQGLDEFRAAGKGVTAFSEYYSQAGYYLASTADEVVLDPMGALPLPGLSRYRMYYKSALDRFKIDWHVFRVGTYKSAVEPYLFDQMSDAAREMNRSWMGSQWSLYRDHVVQGREISAKGFDDYVMHYDRVVTDSRGDEAKAALKYGLVDTLETRAELEERLELDVRGILWTDYQGSDTGDSAIFGDSIAVITARGVITDGYQDPGTIGSDTICELIQEAKNNDSVKALVFRIDSGGGGVYASEEIRRALAEFSDTDRPLLVSMGDVTASGGYWLSTAADQIWASPSTITGSIGIYAMLPVYSRALEDTLGVRVDGLGTSPFAGGYRADKPLNDEMKNLIQASLVHGYDSFVNIVSDSRSLSEESVRALAGGRVYSGVQAKELGLVDRLGSMREALDEAAALAGLDSDYGVLYLESQPDWTSQLMADLMSSRRVGKIEAFAGALIEEPLFDVLKGSPDRKNLYAMDFIDPVIR